MNSCGRGAVVALLDLLRPRALVHLPALGQQREAEHPRDRGLAHLRRAGQHEEVMRLQDRHRALPRRCRNEDPGEFARGLDVNRRAASASGSGGAASSESTDGSFIRNPGRRRIASKSSGSP